MAKDSTHIAAKHKRATSTRDELHPYSQLKHSIYKQETIEGYYQQLIDFTPDILMDISLRNQNRVAQDLGLTSVKFSHLLPLLKELYSVASEADTTVAVKQEDEER